MSETDGVSIQYVALSELQRWPRNPKDHDLGQIHRSIERFGYVNPVLLDERTEKLVAGHGRLDALQQMKASGKQPPKRIQTRDGEWYVPVVRGIGFNSDAEAEAYLLADNRLTELGGWVEDDLATVLSDLAAEGEMALEGVGWDQGDVDQLLADLENGAISRGHYHWRHEPCWYAVRSGETAGWVGDRKQTTVWEITLDENVEGGHGTQKPVECMARPIRNHRGDVYDPFVGSGTTIIAAEQLGRTCYAMEIDPAYCDVIRHRYSEFTDQPELAP